MAASRAASDTAKVSFKVLPGGSSRLIMVWARSAGGTKPVGKSGTSISEPMNRQIDATAVTQR